MNESELNIIRNLREEKGLSQEEMAFELGVSRSSYLKFENGNIQRYSKTLDAFANYFNLSKAELQYGKEVYEKEVNYKEKYLELEKIHKKFVSEKTTEIKELQRRLIQAKNISEVLLDSYKKVLNRVEELEKELYGEVSTQKIIKRVDGTTQE